MFPENKYKKMNEFSIMNYGHDLMLLMITDDDDDDDDGGYMDIYGPSTTIKKSRKLCEFAKQQQQQSLD